MTKEEIKPRKIPKKITELKKPLIAGGFISAIAIASIITGIVILSQEEEEREEIVFIIGAPFGAENVDPLSATYTEDRFISEQVAEGLFDYDYTSETFEPIHNLAVNHSWNDNATELMCILRQNVKFHDGEPFNAAAVKWNFDRINWFINNGSLVYIDLWVFPDGTPIVNETQVMDEYTVKFILNGPYVPFISLLATQVSYILSPNSTPLNDFIDPITGDLVGTGPFIYDKFVPFTNLTMSANPNYWGGKPEIDKLIWKEIPDRDARFEAMSAGKISMLRGFDVPMVLAFLTNPNVTYQEVPFYTLLQYMSMNNKLINVTMRKAISYAMNYTYLLEFYGTNVKRLRSPIPQSIKYSNSTAFDVPYYNITIARQALKDIGWPGTAGLTANDNITVGNEWELLANSSNPIETYNFTYISGNFYQQHLAVHLPEYLKQIGVNVETFNITYYEHFYMLTEQHGYHRNMFELTFIGWLVDFNDPSNSIDTLCSSKKKGFNVGNVNDSLVQLWMEEAIGELNETKREQLYFDIQKRLIEEVFPYAWFYTGKRFYVYRSDVRGWYPNPFKQSFKTVYFE